jgi:hypothetical protein
MNWKEQVKVEKGLVDKTKGLIKRIKDASFKRKLKKFLADNLDVKYERDSNVSQRRVDTKSQSLESAKKILLETVEEVFDEFYKSNFPETRYDSPVYDPEYIPSDAP